MKVAVLAVSVLSFVAPAGAAGQGVSLQGAIGSQVNGGGISQSVAVGFWPGARVGFLIGVERIHLPTRITHFDHGVGATRGGTTRFISGEVHVSPVTFDRVSPYGLAGAGRGTTRPNVNEIFPDPVSRDDATLLFAGGGIGIALTDGLRTFADLRFVLQLDDSEAGVFLFVPVRAGLAWRF